MNQQSIKPFQSKRRKRSFKWAFNCVSCTHIETQEDLYQKEDVIAAARKLVRKGLISKEEFAIIVEADMKYRDMKHVTTIFSDMEECDPISLEPLGEHIYCFTTTTGKTIKYNLETIVNYVLKSGDLHDPVTRCIFMKEDIARMDAQASAAGICCILRETVESNEKYNIRRLHQYEIRGLESCLGEIIFDILHAIENPKDDDISITMLCSHFSYPFNDMKNKDLEASYAALMSWISFLRGPPKRPTKNKGRKLGIAIQFLESQWTAENERDLSTIRNCVPTSIENAVDYVAVEISISNI